MYKKIVKIVRRGMIIYILCIVFPDEIKLVVKSVGLILEGGICWLAETLWEGAKESATESLGNWWDGVKESAVEGLKSLIPFKGGE